MSTARSSDLLSPRQVAERLNVTTGFVYGAMYGGKLPYLRLGARTVRIRESALKRFIDARSYGS